MNVLKLIGDRNSAPTIDFNSVVKCDNLYYWSISMDTWEKTKVTLKIIFEEKGIESTITKSFDNIMEAVEYFYNFLKTL